MVLEVWSSSRGGYETQKYWPIPNMGPIGPVVPKIWLSFFNLVCGSIEKEQLKSYVYISGTTGSIGPKFGMGYYFWIS